MQLPAFFAFTLPFLLTVAIFFFEIRKRGKTIFAGGLIFALLLGVLPADTAEAANTPKVKQKNIWIEGTAEEVICLGFMLDIGDIKEPVDSVYRKELLYSMYAQNQWEQDNEWDNEWGITIPNSNHLSIIQKLI